MNTNLTHLINGFTSLRVLVVGDAMLDSYLEGSAGRISREAPVPIVSVAGRRDLPGGAANTAANVSALGASVSLLSVIGDDTDGAALTAALVSARVSGDDIVVEPTRLTLTKQRIFAGGQMLVRFDQGSTGPVSPESQKLLLSRLRALWEQVEVVIVSDHAQGILSPALIGELAKLQERKPVLLAVDSGDLAAYRHTGVTVVKPNYEEALRMLELPSVTWTKERLLQVAAAGDRLLEISGAHVAAITLDRDGALIFERGHEPYRTYARPRDNSRAAGAGDTFIGALALSLAAGADTTSAAEIASAAAAVVVDKEGTACCSAQELRVAVSLGGKYITDSEDLVERIKMARAAGQRIVFTNGCFDILHRGHITYLNRAKALGDVLVVALNSDASVRRLKGAGRPINGLEDRAEVLSALSCIDYVVPFSDDTPRDLIRSIRPDLFVKGGDYTVETLPEAPLVEELGGSVQILPYLDATSTSRIIERIRAE